MEPKLNLKIDEHLLKLLEESKARKDILPTETDLFLKRILEKKGQKVSTQEVAKIVEVLAKVFPEMTVIITPREEKPAPRKLGGYEGKIRIPPDFDEDDEEIIKLFEG